ncbi:kanadaptin-like [Antedon mediterranea]|uniref:kanadaptin-like n=1 Tax=Antedon mediterranea TaxID=105859 RepID=UPI003AF8E538
MQPACLLGLDQQQGKPGSKPIPGESSNSTSSLSDGAGTSRPRVGVGDSGDISFKMPIFKNPIRKTSKKVKVPKILADQSVSDSTTTLVQPEYKKNVDNNIINNIKLKKKARPSQRSPAEIIATPPPPYREPAWSGIPQDEHYLEVLKGGTICDKIGLNDHAFHLFGRLESNHVQLDHPSLSRYHAVLQYRTIGDNDHDPGFYLYDLDSTHGTTLNKKQIEPKVFCRVLVGHMFKLAGSTRLYILQGGNTSMDGTRNDLSIEQLKDMQQRQMEEKELLRMKEMEEETKEHVKEDDSNTGISWGMADDADAESDLSHNPFALDADDDKEAPYLKDPKKALRGFFEREDIELEYNVEEMGIGRSHQYICKVVLPLDDPSGKSIVAEAAVSGKKKEAVLACALEACKILDRHGVLRQAKHESKKRKDKNWAADDYYDSDEDTFLDRTGEIEKKRLKRMRKAGAEKQEILTYDKLVGQLEELEKEMKKVEDNLAKMANDKDENKAEDSLDAFMDSIKSGFKDRNQRAKLKLRLVDLRKEHMKLKKLIDIAKPAKIPELKGTSSSKSTSSVTKPKTQALIGKMHGAKKFRFAPLVSKVSAVTVSSQPEQEVEEEEDDEEEEEEKTREEETNKISGDSSETSHHGELQARLSTNVTEKTKLTPEVPKIPLSQKQSGPSMPHSKGKRTCVSQVSLPKGPTLGPMLPPSYMKEDLEKDNEKERGTVNRKQDRISEEAVEEELSDWVPPAGQTGDGRTSLNDKFGY